MSLTKQPHSSLGVRIACHECCHKIFIVETQSFLCWQACELACELQPTRWPAQTWTCLTPRSNGMHMCHMLFLLLTQLAFASCHVHAHELMHVSQAVRMRGVSRCACAGVRCLALLHDVCMQCFIRLQARADRRVRGGPRAPWFAGPPPKTQCEHACEVPCVPQNKCVGSEKSTQTIGVLGSCPTQTRGLCSYKNTFYHTFYLGGLYCTR
jgi:hypothetical protein